MDDMHFPFPESLEVYRNALIHFLFSHTLSLAHHSCSMRLLSSSPPNIPVEEEQQEISAVPGMEQSGKELVAVVILTNAHSTIQHRCSILLTRSSRKFLRFRGWNKVVSS